MGDNFVAVPMSRVEIRCVAKRFREIFQLENILYVDVVRLLEFILPMFGFEYEIVDKNEMKYSEAITYPDEKRICIREDVYHKAIEGVGRFRLTIMHEIAHAILHGKNRIALARSETKIPSYRNPEWQANAFAGEFLMPSDLTADMRAEEISEKCGVSLAAAKYQLKVRN